MYRQAKAIMKGYKYILPGMLFFAALDAAAQNGKPIIIPTDSTTEIKNPAFTKDTIVKIVKGDTLKIVPKHNPNTATLRSLIVPGWGQAYNREYWKIPIVYGALGTIAGIFIYNNTWYKRAKNAFHIRVSRDTASFPLIYPKLQVYSASDLETIRNSFRRDRDYSTLYFIIFWGLNIADATVFAHLKQFDVSEDLTLQVTPVLLSNKTPGFSLVLGYKSPARNHLPVF